MPGNGHYGVFRTVFMRDHRDINTIRQSGIGMGGNYP